MYKQNGFIWLRLGATPRRVTRYCLAAAAVLALLGPLAQNGRGDFTLTDNQQLTVNSSHSYGTLYDTSRAFIVSGGYVDWLVAHDSSTVDISGGGATVLITYDSSTVDISGGGVGYYINTWGSSDVDISGGTVWGLAAYNSSTVDISGGTVSGGLAAHESSDVDISGGSMPRLDACNSSTVEISGGSVGGLGAYNYSTVDISGGSIANLTAHNSGVVTFYGQNFLATGGLILDGDRVLGTGTLSGEWMDGTPWAVNIESNAPTATILAVIPAPGALILGGIGVGLVSWLRRRRTL